MGPIWRAIMLWLVVARGVAAEADPHRGAEFIGFTNFTTFERHTNSHELVLISRPLSASLDWNELIPSWNYTDTNGGLKLDLRVLYPDHTTKWYCLGQWSQNAAFPRESVKGQKDPDGDVATDTLEMNRPSRAAQVRLTLSGPPPLSALKFIGLSFCDTRATFGPLPANKTGWGKTLQVKERSQANYPEGIHSWCSPTSTSMLLSFWAAALNRPDLDHDVPEVAAGVNDPNWPGTGNWPFNMAYAGAHRGMRAYVARWSDLSELEAWVQAGIPVALSVSYNLLRGRDHAGEGHLVVCIGFTENGDVVFNDPGRKQVRQVYSRENVRKAWADSHRTVYLVYPSGHSVPPDLFGHWFTN